MVEEKITKFGSVNRFGTRYGRTPKARFGEIEHEQRKFHKCPYCSNVKVKRISAGIWQCRKCNIKFTGKAYTLAVKKKPTELAEQAEVEVPEEDLEEITEEEDEKQKEASEDVPQEESEEKDVQEDN